MSYPSCNVFRVIVDINTCGDNDLAQSQQYVYEKCIEDQVGKVQFEVGKRDGYTLQLSLLTFFTL